MQIFWFLPTHGDSRYLGTTDGARAVDLPYLQQIATSADALGYDTVLFGDGIGLDSIDSLEIISAIDEEYGVSMTGVGKEHFRNIDALAAYVVANA